MANDIKNTAKSALRDASESSSDMLSEATPKVKEALHQVSDLASDYYDRANEWLNRGNNRSYGFAALVACVGLSGFFIGRAMGSSHES